MSFAEVRTALLLFSMIPVVTENAQCSFSKVITKLLVKHQELATLIWNGNYLNLKPLRLDCTLLKSLITDHSVELKAGNKDFLMIVLFILC